MLRPTPHPSRVNMTAAVDPPYVAPARIEHGSGGRLWRIRDQPDLAAFAGASWPALVSTLLWHREARSLDEATEYLGEPRELIDAALMPDLDVAVSRLARACR